MRNRIWRLTALSVLVATVLFGALSLAALYRFFTQQTNEALDRELRVTGAAVSLGGDLQTLGTRQSPDAPDAGAAVGTVLFDSQADAARWRITSPVPKSRRRLKRVGVQARARRRRWRK